MMSALPNNSDNTAAAPEESHRKFQKDGTPKLFPGITVLCHLRDTNPTQDALRHAMGKHLPPITHINKTDPPGPSHVELPPQSWHMTILDIRTYDPATWSDDGMTPQVARDADLEKFIEKFGAIKAELEPHLPIRMEISTPHPRNGLPLVVPVFPYDGKSAGRLKIIREKIAKAFDMPPPNRFYKFHISTHYQLREMGKSEFWGLREEWIPAIERVAEEMRAGFEIDAIELCSFDDMFRFDVVERIGGLEWLGDGPRMRTPEGL